jgi:hypothetical protein
MEHPKVLLNSSYNDKLVEKNCGKTKHIMFNNYFYENRADYEIMFKNIAEMTG